MFATRSSRSLAEAEIAILGQHVSWYSLNISLRLDAETKIPPALEAHMDPNAWAVFYNHVNIQILAPLGRKVSIFQALKLASYLLGLTALALIISSLVRQATAEESISFDDGEDNSAIRFALYPLLFIVPIAARGYLKRAIKNCIAKAMKDLELACAHVSTSSPALIVSVIDDRGEVRCGGLEFVHAKVYLAAPALPTSHADMTPSASQVESRSGSKTTATSQTEPLSGNGSKPNKAAPSLGAAMTVLAPAASPAEPPPSSGAKPAPCDHEHTEEYCSGCMAASGSARFCGGCGKELGDEALRTAV
mmetsp:Transcript_48788/g.142222  ORF Transcript_48788/g.142222 Transcript_48788/m.142222 type:complete len:306 (+) Transcript_48788:75-992(+)